MKNLSFFVSLGIAEILGFSELLFILKLSHSKPFHNTLNHVSTANIEEVMKFYKAYETDFNYTVHLKYEVLGHLSHKSLGENSLLSFLLG